MGVHPDIISELQTLPCFTGINNICLLTSGMSHICVKVTTAKQVFFAKRLKPSSSISEISAAKPCAAEGISPNIIYHNKDWLVTKFLTAKPLNLALECLHDKTTIALKLMARCHSITCLPSNHAVPSLNVSMPVNAILSPQSHYQANQIAILDKVTQYLDEAITQLILAQHSATVLCHGDINFTNILVDDEKKPWLIDFECSHMAPLEFDLAMFVAINNIPVERISQIIDSYSKFIPEANIHLPLLNHYILYSLFINGLWYWDNGHKALAIKQWKTFDAFSATKKVHIAQLTPLLV
ncbi:MAG: phosphotransferase [Colwellia sp.]|nr:phosphotransferase [Colwellia sp.]